MSTVTVVDPAPEQGLVTYPEHDPEQIEGAVAAADAAFPRVALPPHRRPRRDKPGMTAFVEEPFGPVVAITPFATEDEAVELANDTRYGLGATVWTQDAERGEPLARRIESGLVSVNAFVASDPWLPFGGIKRSGYGRELAAVGMHEFTNIRTVKMIG